MKSASLGSLAAGAITSFLGLSSILHFVIAQVSFWALQIYGHGCIVASTIKVSLVLKAQTAPLPLGYFLRKVGLKICCNVRLYTFVA
jgi:hypothetical protein